MEIKCIEVVSFFNDTPEMLLKVTLRGFRGADQKECYPITNTVILLVYCSLADGPGIVIWVFKSSFRPAISLYITKSEGTF